MTLLKQVSVVQQICFSSFAWHFWIYMCSQT